MNRPATVAIVVYLLAATSLANAQPDSPDPSAPSAPSEPAEPSDPAAPREPAEQATESPSSIAPTPPPEPVEPPPPPRKTPFDRGKFGLSLGAGSQSAFGQRYFAISGSAGYFVLDGVEVGLGAQHQWGDGPSISRLTPGLRYVAQPLVGKFPLIPYVGVFYSHWFISGNTYDDQDAVGTRGGLLYVSGSIVLGLGIAYERIVSECTMDCSSVYPDFTLSVAL